MAQTNLDDLPDFRAIGRKQISTREFLEPDILAKAERLCIRPVDDVVRFNISDAYAFVEGGEDNESRRLCRKAWTELFMFCKTCLPQLPGGKKKANRNKNSIMCRLQRWDDGERASLWNDVDHVRRNRSSKLSLEQELERRQEVCMAYAQHGAPGKAVSRLVSPGVAPHSDAVTAKMNPSSMIRPPPRCQVGGVVLHVLT